MISLLIDTHFNNAVIVLYKNGTAISIKNIESKMCHSQIVVPLIEETLNFNKILVDELDEIIVVNGPGSFTGVRIGVTIAKTLAYTLNIPIKIISSLLLKAINIEGEKKVAISDRNGSYIGHFDSENNLIGDYVYLSKHDMLKEAAIEHVEIDYNEVYKYIKEIPTLNPHAVKPIYVKQIEVEK